MSVISRQHLLFIIVQIIILPTYYAITSFLCYIDIFILCLLIIYHISQ